MMKFEVADEYIPLDELPEEILLQILKRVPVKSICRVRSVCKSVLQIIDSPFFISMHSASLISANNSFAEEPPHMIRLLWGKSTTSLQSVNLDSHHIAAERLSSSSEILSIQKSWNSSVEEVLNLPNSDQVNQKMLGADRHIYQDLHDMGFDKINNTYKIIRLLSIVIKKGESDVPPCSVALVHELVTGSWREIPRLPFCASNTQVASMCAYGDMHWIFNKKGTNEIWTFDFTKEEFYSTPHPPTSSDGDACLFYIIFKGRLGVASVTRCVIQCDEFTYIASSIDIWVMKDYDTKEWTLDYRINLPPCLQDHAMIASKCICGEWDHGIFFLTKASNKSFFFDLKETLEVRCVKLEESQFSTIHYDPQIFNLKRTFISLKQFENSVRDPKSVGSTNYTSLDFSKKYLWRGGKKPNGIIKPNY